MAVAHRVHLERPSETRWTLTDEPPRLDRLKLEILWRFRSLVSCGDSYMCERTERI